MQGAISTTYVRLLYEYLQQRGLDGASLLGEAPPDASDLGLSRITMRRWAQLLDRAALQLPEPALGLRIGAIIGPTHLGVLGYVIQCCSTLGEALLRLRQFERLVYDAESAVLHTATDRVWLQWGLAHGKPGQLVDETAIAALVSYARKITAQPLIAPLEVSFVNPAPADIAPYCEFFGCPVHFEAPATVVALRPEAMQQPLRQPDPALRDILDRQAEALLAKLPERDDFQQSLQRQLIGLLREGEPDLDRVASQLDCSPRTLQRRLRERGLGFQQLLDQTRHSLALDYLRDPRLQLAEIALLLGYSEQSAFNRAFRRWSGQTPQQARGQR